MPVHRFALLLLAASLVAPSCSAQGKVAPGSGGALLPKEISALPSFDFATYQKLLAELKGTPVVVNIWGSWCGPCKLEAPLLESAAKKYAGKVQFLGVDILDSRDGARAFMRQYGETYPSVFDATGEIRDRLGIIGQPATLFYDASGKLASKWVGAVTEDVLTKGIQQILT